VLLEERLQAQVPCAGEALRENLVFEVALDGALRDAEQLRDGLGVALVLLDQGNRIWAPADFGMGRVVVFSAALLRLSPRMPTGVPTLRRVRRRCP
jgi:hypothetical protein